MKKVLTFDEAAAYTGYKKSYLYRLTCDGIIPHSKPNGRKIFFEREKLEEWLLGNPRAGLRAQQQQAANHIHGK